MSWYEEWFDSPLYEQLYAYRNEEEAAQLARLIRREIPPHRFPRILDLGCGRGRHSLALAKLGYRVTGIDLSETAIRKAKTRAKEQKVTGVDFRVGDMREPLDEVFDAIVNLFTTFGYFEEDAENRNVLSSAGNMLSPGGILMIDFLNAEQVRNTIIPEDRGSFRDIDFEIRRFIRNNMVFKEITFEGPPLKKKVEYRERVKLYDLEWFKTNLDACGFELRTVYGSYTGAPFKKEKSSRLIMISRKRGE